MFFIQTENTQTLKDNWEKITSFIACNYQVSLESEYETWNIYLFFLVKTSIDRDLKYKIENDTFSSRKIIIDYKTDQDSIIKNHILNDNLRIDKECAKTVEDDFIPDPLVRDILKGKIFKKVKIDDEIKDLFNQLVEAVKNEGHEI